MTYPPQQGGGYGPPQGGYQQDYPPGGGYGPPPGNGPPRRSRTPLIIGIVAGVLVIALAVTLLVLFTGDDEPARAGANKGGSSQAVQPPGGPASGGQVSGPATPGPAGSGTGGAGAGSVDDLANKIIDTIDNQDFDAIDKLACDARAATGMKNEMAKLRGLDISATLDDVQENGSTGSVDLTLTGEGAHQSVSVELAQNGGQWCAAGL